MVSEPARIELVRLSATLLWICYVGASYWYAHAGDSLIFCDADGSSCEPISVLLSSGGEDDNLQISMGALFGFAPALLSICRWRRPVLAREYVIWACVLGFQLFWALLIEVGSISLTVRNGASPALLVWCLSLLGLATIIATGLIARRLGARA